MCPPRAASGDAGPPFAAMAGLAATPGDAGGALGARLEPLPRRSAAGGGRKREASGRTDTGGGAVKIENRWFQLCASLVAMIMIANLQYSWTLFVKPLQKGT